MRDWVAEINASQNHLCPLSMMTKPVISLYWCYRYIAISQAVALSLFCYFALASEGQWFQLRLQT